MVKKERKGWGEVTQNFHCNLYISFCKENAFWEDKDYLCNQKKKNQEFKNYVYGKKLSTIHKL